MSVAKEIPKVVQWLRDQVAQAKCNGLVVGLSGGIDSSVVAALIKQAYPQQSLGIIIPIHSNPADAQDAVAAAEQIGLTYYNLDLSTVHTQIIDQSFRNLADLGYQAEKKMADANLRARLRMATIYTAANALNYLVVGTDNAAELYTGYFTKYGDGGVDILPLAEFTKGEVKQLAEALDVPTQIITKPPSAGLWEGQTDETEMGTTYQHIDAFLKGEAIPEQDRALIQRLHGISSHKRTTPPIYHREK